jgi:hypothetical protein
MRQLAARRLIATNFSTITCDIFFHEPPTRVGYEVDAAIFHAVPNYYLSGLARKSASQSDRKIHGFGSLRKIFVARYCFFSLPVLHIHQGVTASGPIVAYGGLTFASCNNSPQGD